MEIAASEAAVERFFSQLKCNIGDRRERMTATAAVSQVLFNSSLDFIENVTGRAKPRARDVVSDDDNVAELTAIPLSTWQWIFDYGCAGHWSKVANAHGFVEELQGFFDAAEPRQPVRPAAAAAAAAAAAPAALAAPPAPAAPARRARAEAAPPAAAAPVAEPAPVRMSPFGRVIQPIDRFQYDG
jgi:hypothetical protein